jgi:hypothetical protein
MRTEGDLCPIELSWATFQRKVPSGKNDGIVHDVAAPAIVGRVLKALGLVHDATLHTWLLDVGHKWLMSLDVVYTG